MLRHSYQSKRFLEVLRNTAPKTRTAHKYTNRGRNGPESLLPPSRLSDFQHDVWTRRILRAQPIVPQPTPDANDYVQCRNCSGRATNVKMKFLPIQESSEYVKLLSMIRSCKKQGTLFSSSTISTASKAYRIAR